MQPIAFSSQATLPLKPEEIASQILDLSKWPEFNGYGPLPGIKQAEFETKTVWIAGRPEMGPQPKLVPHHKSRPSTFRR